jgi:poly(3-hydroxybutyrate) depolymerase
MIRISSPFVLVLMVVLLYGCTAPISPNEREYGYAPERNRSVGCGIPEKGHRNFMPMEIRVLDKVRTYHLFVPIWYDPNRAYPLIFTWHGSGGDGLSGGLDIKSKSRNDAIVVAADGLNGTWNSDTDSPDLVFFDRMLENIENGYCVDRDRIFSYGFSVGGYFTNLLACERGNVLRASASVAGGLAGENCKGKVAAWFLHDENDDAVPIAEGRAARDRALAINGCSTNTDDEGDGCVRYQGCNADPVVWCESRGIGHNIRGKFAPPRVWKFFRSLH